MNSVNDLLNADSIATLPEKDDTLEELPAKLLESQAAGFKDRSKRRLSLPISGISGSRKSSIISLEGDRSSDRGGKTGDRRRSSVLSNDSWSETSYTDYDSDEGCGPGGPVSPRQGFPFILLVKHCVNIKPQRNFTR